MRFSTRAQGHTKCNKGADTRGQTGARAGQTGARAEPPKRHERRFCGYAASSSRPGKLQGGHRRKRARAEDASTCGRCRCPNRCHGIPDACPHAGPTPVVGMRAAGLAAGCGRMPPLEDTRTLDHLRGITPTAAPCAESRKRFPSHPVSTGKRKWDEASQLHPAWWMKRASFIPHGGGHAGGHEP